MSRWPDSPPPAPRAGLAVTLGQCSRAGLKPANQDFHGALIPEGNTLALKGISVLLADGISSSPAGAQAAEMAVKSFLSDYYCAPESWTVKTAASRVIQAANSWLFAETRRAIGPGEMDRGHVCTFDAVVVKSRAAHLFHVGDGRIWRIEGDTAEPLTRDHRIAVTSRQSHLARALGMAERVEIDYRAVPLNLGDLLVMTTDGVHEYCSPREMARLIGAAADDLDRAAERIVEAALAAGSPDNLTVQIIRMDRLPAGDTADVFALADTMTPPPMPQPGSSFEGWEVIRPLHRSHRSHVWLVADPETGERAALKLLSTELAADPEARRRLAMEEWIARRIRSPHVLEAIARRKSGPLLYTLTAFVEGQTLAQWMADHPAPELEQVRDIVEQIARGLRAFHRKEILHRDLRPENILIDRTGTVKIIDFGAVHVPGVRDTDGMRAGEVPGAIQYAAPEYFVGLPATSRSDQFSLGVIAYQMLTGWLPYGAAASRLRAPRDLRRLRYRPASGQAGADRIPAWIDGALSRAVHPDPHARYPALSEFLADLRRPNPRYAPTTRRPLLERDPIAFWRGLSALLAVMVVIELFLLVNGL